MEKLFLRIYDFFARGRRWLSFLIPLVLLAGFWLCIRKISLNEDIAAFLPYGSGESSRQSQFVYQNLRKQDKVMGLIRLKESKEDIYETIDLLAQAADEFAFRVEEAQIDGIKDPMLRVDASSMLGVASFIAENMPYFLDSADYSAMDSIVLKGEFLQALEEDKASLVSSSGITQGITSADPFHFSSALLKKLSDLGSGSGYKVIGDYLYTPDSSAIMVSFSSEYGGSETSHNKQMLSRVYEARDSVQAIMPDVEMTFTGSPVIAVMNADRMKKDSVWCAGIAIGLIVLLLAWYFRRLRPIVLICIPVIFGIAAGLAFMGAFKSEVSSVALAACCVIFGIAVDYSLLYSTRLGFTRNARIALGDIASPMVIGNITTVGAFLSLLVMSASGMRDFGLFAAVALVGAILFVVLFLPHWVGRRTTGLETAAGWANGQAFARRKAAGFSGFSWPLPWCCFSSAARLLSAETSPRSIIWLRPRASSWRTCLPTEPPRMRLRFIPFLKGRHWTRPWRHRKREGLLRSHRWRMAIY